MYYLSSKIFNLFCLLFMSFFLKLCRLQETEYLSNFFVFLSSNFSFILFHTLIVLSFMFLISFFLSSVSVPSLSFTFLNNNFPSLLHQKNFSHYPFYMHVLPLHVLLVFIQLFICCLFSLSRFYHICFPFLSYVFCLWPLFKTCIWNFCNFLSVYLFCWAFF